MKRKNNVFYKILHTNQNSIKDLIALCAACAAFCISRPALAASGPGDVVGKVTVGYQGWFACVGDGAPIDAWWHWSANWSQPPSPSNNAIKAWPYMPPYSKTYQTAYANLNNGNTATLFSSYDQSTINTQFQWMQQNNIDTAALQRFDPFGGEGPTRDAISTKVMNAAQTYGRKFYIMYDCSGWPSNTFQSDIESDWNNEIVNTLHLTASSAYAKQNGKPVVCIWGFGYNDPNHPFDTNTCIAVINWFKNQGCYVIGGVPTDWRTGTGNGWTRPGYLSVYHDFNMLSPWLVGVIGNISDADNVYNNYMVGDQAYCNANGIDYQPCVLPGDLSARQRVHGNLMWEEFYNVSRLGCQGVYISMYDEYGEGNQIAETAPDTSWVPSNSGLLGLNEDGTWCSPDYYLRLTRDGGDMFKGQIPLCSTRLTVPAGDPPAPSSGHVYHLICLTSGMALDNTGSTTAGTQVWQWTDEAGNANQEWELVDAGNGWWNLVCQKSGMALDNTGSTSAGTIMTQWNVNPGNINQNWEFISMGGGYYQLICQRSNMALDNGGSTSNGAYIKQWYSNPGNINQYWMLEFIR